MVCSKDNMCNIWDKNVCSGVKYDCKCNVLHNEEIRFIPT